MSVLRYKPLPPLPDPDDHAFIASMKEWLDAWGEGPNWSDKTGATVPVTKEALARLLSLAKPGPFRPSTSPTGPAQECDT
jgi:hypothetical protein